MVPNGWEQKSFKDILKLDRGSSPRPIVNFMTDGDDGVNWIKIGDTKGEAAFINSTKEKITKEGAKKSRKVSKGEIILSNSMSYGKPYILNIDGYIHDGWFVIRNYEQNLDKGYLIQLLGGEIVQRQYQRLAAGGVVTNISSELVYFVKVNLPPLPEQRKIAKILSTWDKAISTTERLIDNSKQQKKALMQQLLTGKKRLLDDSGKPFEGEWEESSIDSCFKLITDYVASGSFASLKENVSVSDYENFAHYVRQTDLAAKFTNRNLKWVDERSYNFLVKSNLHEGDILFTNIGDLGKVFYMPRLKKPATVAPNLVVLRVNESNDSKFIYYLLASDVGQREIHKIKSGTGLPKINKTEFKTMKFQIPALNEQQKIASVLSTADNELELLEQQLADLKQEKKALMQQLLTGKRRVAV